MTNDSHIATATNHPLHPTPPPEIEDVRAIADQAIQAAGQILRAGLGQVQRIRHKGETDLVTEYDHRVEETVVRLILARFPRHQILAEEGSIGGDDPDHVWIIDPLDGTTNFAHGYPVFCCSIAYEYQGRLALSRVCDPIRNELFQAEAGAGALLNHQPIRVSDTARLVDALLATGFPYDRGKLDGPLAQWERFVRRTQAVRRNGSAALSICYVAAGRLDGFWEEHINAWDTAGGALLVMEAGGTVTALDGQPYEPRRGGILAASAALHPTMLDVLRNCSEAAPG